MIYQIEKLKDTLWDSSQEIEVLRILMNFKGTQTSLNHQEILIQIVCQYLKVLFITECQFHRKLDQEVIAAQGAIKHQVT